MITREGKTDSETRIKMRERKQDAKELLPETPCGSFVYNEVSDLYKEVPSGFLASHLIKATPHPVPKVSER